MSGYPAAFFSIFAGLALVFSMMVVLLRNPVSSAFSMVMAFFSFAGIYAVLSAHLVAAMQILVYTGAIMVLFVFVIMLLNADVPSDDLRRSGIAKKLAAAGLSAGLFLIFARALAAGGTEGSSQGPFTEAAIEAAGGNTRVLAELMFSEFLLPFELTSVLLLVAIVGAVAIAKRKPALKGGNPGNA